MDYGDLPFGKLRVCYWTWPIESIEIVDVPRKDDDFPVRKLLVYQWVSHC